MDCIDLAARVEALEASNRRFRAWGGLLAVCLVAAVALGQTAPPVKALEAESLTLRDKNGKTRIRIGPGDEGAWEIAVLDAREKPRAGVRVRGNEIPEVYVADASGGRSTQLSAVGDNVGLYLWAGGGKLRGYFITNEDLPIWDLLDESGRTRCGASIIKAGSAGISLFGKDGATRAGLINNPDDSTRLTLRSGPLEKETRACELKVTAQGAAKLDIADPQGKQNLTLGVQADGAFGLGVVDAAKKVQRFPAGK